MRRHISDHIGEATFSAVKARKLFHDGQLERFEDEGNYGISNAIGLAVKNSVPVAGPGAMDESARLVSPFLNASGWLSLLRDLDEDIAKNTVCLMTAERSDRFVRLKSACRDLVEDINTMVRDAAYPILELMTPENFHDKQSHNFRALQEQSTVYAYSLRLTRLIEFMVLTADTMESLEYALTDDQVHLREVVKEQFASDEGQNAVVDLIALVTSLFSHNPPVPRERNQFMQVYMVMESITVDLEFKAQSSMSGMIAELQWLCRAFIFRRATMGAESLAEQQAAVLGAREILIEQRITPYNCIRSAMRQLASSGPTAMFENAIWFDESKRALTVDEKELELEDLRSGTKKMIKDLEQNMKALFHGEGFGGLYPELGAVRDNLRNAHPGYSFTSDPRNLKIEEQSGTWAGLPKALKKLLTTSTSEFGKMADGGWSWDTTYIEAWLQMAKKFLELLACVIHITGGGPPRAEEGVTFAIKNCNGKMRNIFVHGKHVVFVGQYHKSQNIMLRYKLIARLLPEKVSELVLQYLYIIRPIENVLLRVLGENTANAETFFYSSKNKIWTGERYRKVFARTTDAYLKEGLGIQEWRHASVTIMRDHGIECPEEEGEKYTNLQTGHVGATAHAYGRTESYFTTLTSSECLGYFKNSKAWHVFLGLAAGSLVRNVSDKMEVREGSVAKTEVIYHHVWEPQSPESRGSLKVEARIIEALIRMTKNVDARLRPNQVAPVLAVLQRKDNVLVVMPTGGGKTLVYMLPAMLEEDKVTVVMTPLM
ncbi:hypothetical protein H0X32_04210 [Patescibacteria group bacterium]|nr:hypothetical protein [Patescibacteria group bacterium]